MKDIKAEIERLKKELHALVNQKNVLTSEDIVKVSQRLDLLINKYYA